MVRDGVAADVFGGNGDSTIDANGDFVRSINDDTNTVEDSQIFWRRGELWSKGLAILRWYCKGQICEPS